MEHSLEKDFNPYRNYTRSNLILGLPIFIIQLLLIFFSFSYSGNKYFQPADGCVFLFEICFSIFSIDFGTFVATLLYS